LPCVVLHVDKICDRLWSDTTKTLSRYANVQHEGMSRDRSSMQVLQETEA